MSTIPLSAGALPNLAGQKVVTSAMHDNRTVTNPASAAGSEIKFPTVPARRHPVQKMTALTFQGKEKLAVEEMPRVAITDPTDAIVRMTTSTICGSDLHLYHHEFTGIDRGMIPGHEAVGIVEEVGPAVRDIKVGDRVVISAVIACGACEYCAEGKTGLCDRTNPGGPGGTMEKLFGHRTAGLFGYSSLMGNYEGLQASHARVPIADVNLFKVNDSRLPDESLLFLSDIWCTAWHALEVVDVKETDTVLVLGLGPIGMLSAYLARTICNAKRVIGVDPQAYRLEMAMRNIPGIECINASTQDVVKTVQDICPGGPTVSIDAAAFRYARGILHTAMRAVGMETDTSENLNELMTLTKKGGRISVIADYYALTNGFNVGAMMEKSLTLRGAGQLWPHKDWRKLLAWMEEGRIAAPWLITHTFPLSDAPRAYDMFDKKQDGMMKIILKP